MLKEMRDAAGDSGEFYTPRPVVQLMVALVDPQLGEKVLDPACGTGGFLVETYEHIKKSVNTPEDGETLQRDTLFGGEAKSLPYLLGEMNMLLHGVEVPNIGYGNSLAVKLTELGDGDRVDVILTNPPFGGEEEASIKTNFPADKQTSETALLFLQLIMRRLRRPGHPAGAEGGRAAVVVPNGTLFGDGVCARIKEQLLTEFNLHTVVRLSNGVFAPYTSIPTNVLFFDRTGPTKDIWLEVFAVPGSVEMTQAEGTNALIRDGAHLLTRGSEVLDVLGWQPSDSRVEGGDPAGHPGLRSAQSTPSPSASDSDLGRVRAAFGPGPRVLDQLVPDVVLPVSRILAALTRLELNGTVARTGEGWSLTRPRR